MLQTCVRVIQPSVTEIIKKNPSLFQWYCVSCSSTLQFIPLTFRDKNSPLHRLFTGFCKLSMRCDIFLPSVLIIKLSNVNAQHKGNKIKAFYCHSYGLSSEVVCPCCFGCHSFHLAGSLWQPSKPLAEKLSNLAHWLWWDWIVPWLICGSLSQSL